MREKAEKQPKKGFTLPPRPNVREKAEHAKDEIESKLLWLKDAKALTSSEASGFRKPLFDALKEVWRYADEGVTLTNRDGAKAFIWQTIDSEETYILVDALLNVGLRNPAAAQAVRAVVNAWKQVQVGVILLPRFYATWRFYIEHGGFGFPRMLPDGSRRPGPSGPVYGAP